MFNVNRIIQRLYLLEKRWRSIERNLHYNGKRSMGVIALEATFFECLPRKKLLSLLSQWTPGFIVRHYASLLVGSNSLIGDKA